MNLSTVVRAFAADFISSPIKNTGIIVFTVAAIILFSHGAIFFGFIAFIAMLLFKR